MGCDIHLFTERKRSINNEQKWVNVDNWKLNPYYKENDEESKYNLNSAYRHRNYALFSILADVRNSSKNKPISEPKGLPEDISEVVKAESDKWNGDGHSHSFFTMKELYDYYEQNNIVKFSGLVDENGAKEIEAGKMPNWWCKESNEKGLIWKEWQQENYVLKNFIEALERHFESEYYIKEKDSEKFRIVFWFDN
ncbi:MAG: hypothetical protein GX963_09225 [Bacteroidales bacterium]|nr:hypothetical protein [Bacteroidales bacterium]